MASEQWVRILEDAFSTLIDTAGSKEHTTIYPNAEVIDSAPADLPSTYIIIQDERGYYIPAVKVPGVTYSNGDLVNILYVKGTEPIAFQHGSGSSGGGGGSGYPFVVMNANTGTEYASLTAADIAASSGDTLIIGTDLVEDVRTTKALSIVGLSPNISLTGDGSSAFQTIRLDYRTYIQDLTILDHASNAFVVYIAGETDMMNVYVTATNSSVDGIRCNATSRLEAVYVTVSGALSYALESSQNVTKNIYGGVYSGVTADLLQTTGTFNLHGPTLVNNTVSVVGGTLNGQWYDGNGVMRYREDNTPADGEVPTWSVANSRWEPTAPSGGSDNTLTWLGGF